MALYDVLYDPAYASGAGNAAWVGLLRSPITTGVVAALDYVRLGGLHFLACNNEATIEVNVWDQGAGGALTTYTIGAGGSTPGSLQTVVDLGDNAYQVVQLVTDGTDVWLVAYVLASRTFTVGHTFTAWQPTIYLWNGAGFTQIGVSLCETLNRGNDTGNARGAIGRIAACASAAEAGVMYFTWSESGSQFDIFTGDHSLYKQRMVIVKCDTAGVVSELDLFSHTSLVGIQAGTYNTAFETYATPAVTQYVLMSNAAGSPLLYYALPDHYNTTSTAGNATYPDTVAMVDVATSAADTPAVLQTITGSSFDAAITSLPSAAEQTGLGGSRSPVTVSAVPTVYLGVPFSTNGLRSGVRPKFLAAPADGSSAFTYSDAGSGSYSNWFADDWDDTDNIWTGSLESGTSSKGVSHYHRECPGSESFGQFIPDVASPVGTVEGPTIAVSGDHLYVPGRSISPDTKSVGIIDVSILRDYRSCGGLHGRYPPI